MKKRKIFIIAGASGSGKTAIKTYLQDFLGKDFIVDDLERFGLPKNAENFDDWVDWRKESINQWYNLSKEKNKICVILAAAFPYEIVRFTKHLDFDIYFGMIFCSAKIRKQRLKKRCWDKEMVAVNVRTNRKIIDQINCEKCYCLVENSNRCIIETAYLFYKWILNVLDENFERHVHYEKKSMFWRIKKLFKKEIK